MCQFRELYRGEEGYIIRCAACKHYQILFSGVVLSLNEPEYAKFSSVAAACEQDFLNYTCTGNVPMPAMRQGVYLLLNNQKIKALNAMLEAADTEAKTLALFQLFEPGKR